jgi:predicted thioesterase
MPPTVVVVQVSAGARGEVVAVVTDGDTAVALGSGSLPVLATPRLLAWCEAATCAALDGRLPEGASSVGTSVRLEHLAASGLGEQVGVAALLTTVDGRRLVFEVVATDAGGAVVGRGTVERVVVDDARFLARLARPGTPSP